MLSPQKMAIFLEFDGQDELHEYLVDVSSFFSTQDM